MTGPDLSAEALDQLTQQASFVFSGRIEALGASNLDGVEPEEHMVTVLVDDVALAPRDVGDLRQQVVTVYVQSLTGLDVGQRLTFFAQSWHYGKNIGVVEVSRVSEFGRTADAASNLKDSILQSRMRQFDEHLVARLRDAEVVLSARVLGTRKAESSDGMPGEHEGVEWWNADLWIASVEKGSPPADNLLWFPEGGDRDWGPIPKAYPGQEGVWLLRSAWEAEAGEDDEPSTPDPSRPRRLMALDQSDYHAMSGLARIQALLWVVSEG